MKYVYFVNGEQRNPSPEEIQQMTDAAMLAAGYEPEKENKRESGKADITYKDKFGESL